MGVNTQLFKVGDTTFRVNHLLIIGVLALSFTVSLLIRSQVLDYGFELHEFDPFFNYRATEFLVNNGLPAYYEWYDYMSWYPDGRDISATSQTALHLTAAATYQVFGSGMDLYGYVIIFSGVIGALTAIIVFALVRVIGGTTAGLFACMFYAVSVPIMLRGMFGWFKSEPLGLFYGLLGLYLLLSGIKDGKAGRWSMLCRVVGGGIFLGCGMGSWGGVQFFVMPIGILILVLPFLRKDLRYLTYAIPTFVASFLLATAAFERPGIEFAMGVGGISLIVPTIFLVIAGVVRSGRFGGGQHNMMRNTSLLLAGIVVAGALLVVAGAEAGVINMPTFRYLNAINPFLTTTDPLVDSVSEHATTTIQHSFFMNSIFIIFAGIGAWLIFSRTRSAKYLSRDMAAFALILGLTGVYVSSAFVRLEIFASMSIIILSSVGLAILTREVMMRRDSGDAVLRSVGLKVSYAAVIVMLVTLPLVVPVGSNWISVLDVPPTILNGGTGYNIVTSDWKDTFEWIGTNTPKDAVIAAWWDYGYWITTMSNRTTLADNFTTDTEQIQDIARIFLSTPDDGWMKLREMNADYLVVFVAGEKLGMQGGSDLYLLAGGGDESKKQWFMKIAEEPVTKYLHSDGLSGTDYFWTQTLLGHAFPFTILAYVDPYGDDQSSSYVPGFTPVYTDNVKYPAEGSGPLRLAYASPSFTQEDNGPMLGVFVYEVNQDYVLGGDDDGTSQTITIAPPTPDTPSGPGVPDTQSNPDVQDVPSGLGESQPESDMGSGDDANGDTQPESDMDGDASMDTTDSDSSTDTDSTGQQ